MRLPNKSGTVYKLSGKRRNPWIARAYSGHDEYGVRKYETLGYFRTKTEALHALMEFNADPYDIDARKTTFGQIFSMVREEKAKDLKPNTVLAKYDRINSAFFSDIQNMPFADLRPVHYQRILDSKASAGAKASYLNNAIALLHVMYEFAALNDIVFTDYSKGVSNRGVKSEVQPFFTRDEVLIMLKHLQGTGRLSSCLLMCLTGLRPSELLNLGKETVDLEKKMFYDVGIKTTAGKRKRIPIHSLLFPYIKDMYENCENYFYEHRGKKEKYKYFLDHEYTPELEAIGLEYKSPKACRHTFANLTYGILSDKERTSMIGHTDVSFTDEVYTYLEDNQLHNAYENVIKSLTKV